MAEEAREWLKRRDAFLKAERDSNRILKRRLVSSSCILSAAPDLVKINDSEENPFMLLRFNEKRLGLSALVESSTLGDGAFKPISKEEFLQAFALEKLPRLVDENSSGSPKSRTSETQVDFLSGMIILDEDSRQLASNRYRLSLLGSSNQGIRSSSPVPSTIGPTIEAGSPSATPAKSPTTQLPSEARNTTTTSTSSTTQSVGGPSPMRKASIANDTEAMIKECTYFDTSLATLGEPLERKPTMGYLVLPKPLIEEYSRLLDALENITNWPIETRTMIKAFSWRGLPNGNPFVDLRLWIEDHSSELLDLRTIRQRVLNRTHYRWFYLLEQDLNNMCSQLKKTFEGSKTMSALVNHFSDCVGKELQTSRETLLNYFQ